MPTFVSFIASIAELAHGKTVYSITNPAYLMFDVPRTDACALEYISVDWKNKWFKFARNDDNV